MKKQQNQQNYSGQKQQTNNAYQKSKYLGASSQRPDEIPQDIMDELKPPFVPTYLWFAKVIGAVLIALIILFFVGNAILKPYMIKSPIEITPWLDDTKPKTSILGV